MLSLKLADFIHSISFADLGQQTVRMARLALLDWLGSVARGGQEEPAKIALSLIVDQGGKPQATILPSGVKTSALNAALANGIASHILEVDDVHRGSVIHCGAAVIPAALAAAEMTRASGRQFIEALVAGYEVAIRIGEAVTPSHYYFWHNTGTCGTFGACAAASKLLGLNREQLVWALGSAGTQAAGLWEFLADGAMSKHLHPGKAAQNGLLSALLAGGGFTGATAILEGKRGFCRATAPEFNLDRITDSLGKPPYKIEDNSFKIHSSCRHTHPAVDIALGLTSSHNIELSDISAIEVRTYKTALDITDTPEPQTVYAAKFNLPFCVALALAKKGCGLEDFNDENLRDPEIRALSRRTKLIADDAFTSLYPSKWAAAVEIATKSGDVLRNRTDFPLGDPENPASDEVLTEKFRRLSSDSWGDEKTGSLIKTVMELEVVKDMSLLFEQHGVVAAP
ncbi:MAG: MmgE/PrpD family protein [Thermodesulfobacteriota bacterium]